MYLKRLELFGFKSFADKLEIVFPPGITAVVGPNGSGKSNISDALRWVLGEQSIRSLRGLRTEDVIFAGSEQRKPLGMAEVTLVLDNSDGALPLEFSEVSVTRRIYRSGDSEFLINKAPVRLREIQELFLDTGLGKEAYSVIGQGKIEAILSARSEERRAVFEEAAGIMRYKNKKGIAVRKLDDTESNLIRIADIIAELETQLGPLGIQAAQARQFNELSDSLRVLEVNCYGREIKRLGDEEERLSTDMTAHMQQLENTATDVTVEEAALETARSQIDAAAVCIETIQDRLAAIQTSLEGSSGSERVLLERKGNLLNEKTRIENNLALLAEKVSRTEQDLAAEQARLAGLKVRGCTAAEQVAASEATLLEHTRVIQSLNDAIENLRRQIVSNLSEAAQARHQVDTMEVEAEFLARRIEETGQEETAMLNRKEQSATRRAELSQSLHCIQRDIAAEQQTLAEAEQHLLNAQGELSGLESEQKALLGNYHKMESRLSALLDMDQAYQGFSEGVRAILGSSSRGAGTPSEGVRGTVADLIKVHHGFEAALEVALGSALQFIVVDREKNAQAAIAWLKSSGRGRATFLPLDMIESRDRDMTAITGAMARYEAVPAISVLDFQQEYEPVIRFLLGNTMVAPDLEKAVGLSRQTNKTVRVVTLAGDIVNPGGSMTGGSRDRRGAGILERKKEIGALQEELDNKQHELAKLKEVIQNTAVRVDSVRGQWQSAGQNKQHLAMQAARVEKELEMVDAELERLSAQIGQLQQERHSIGLRRQACFQKRESLSGDIEQLQNAGCLLEEKLRSLENEVKERQSSKEDDYRILAELQSALAAARLEETGSERQCETMQLSLAGLQSQMTDERTALERLERENARVCGEMDAEKSRRQELENRRVELEEQLRGLRAERLNRHDELRLREDELKTRRKRITDLQNRIHRQELRLTGLRNELGNLRGHLVESYGPGWADAMQETGDTLETHRGRIEALKAEIRLLGPVNTGAIEEYRRVKERHEFLLIQHEDLVKARDALLRVIEEIEQTTTRRFLETFDQIRHAFIDVFTQLFQGGRADLFLIDPEKPLESGIEIVAQPPGKRQQVLTLLSGGERALTAIALLFAILRVKPTPFCILDEIDATLDEANVHRFADLLSSFSRDTQFIIVTHRRGTMELSDALYGVTMEEMGVSKLVSLQLKKRAG